MQLVGAIVSQELLLHADSSGTRKVNVCHWKLVSDLVKDSRPVCVYSELSSVRNRARLHTVIIKL
jgi:hypothetical protein